MSLHKNLKTHKKSEDMVRPEYIYAMLMKSGELWINTIS